MASGLRMVRSPFQNVSLSGWGRGQDRRNDSTLAIFTGSSSGGPASHSRLLLVYKTYAGHMKVAVEGNGPGFTENDSNSRTGESSSNPIRTSRSARQRVRSPG